MIKYVGPDSFCEIKMTDRNAWMYSEWGGYPVYEENGGLTEHHPDFGSKAEKVNHRTIIAKLALKSNVTDKYSEEEVSKAIVDYEKSKKNLLIHEWLGMDEFEYKAFIEKRCTIMQIIKERRYRISASH